MKRRSTPTAPPFIAPASEPGGLAHAVRALQHTSYRTVFIAFGVNQAGFWLSHVALQGLMVDLTGGDTTKQGFLFFALFSPAFFVAPFAGVIADRVDRQKMMIVGYCYIGVVALANTVLTATGVMTWWLLLICGLLLGLGFSMLGPASSALVANTVPMTDMASAVSLHSVANNLTRVAGPILAAIFLLVSGPSAAFAAYAVSTLIAAYLISTVRMAPFVPEAPTPVITQLRDGLDHAKERPPTRLALSLVAACAGFGVSSTALMPTFVTTVLELDKDPWFPLLVASTGVGAIVGALVVGSDRRDPTLPSSAVLALFYGALVMVFAASPNIWVALGVQVIIGYFYFGAMTKLQTLIQLLADDAKRGRVMALFQMAWGGIVPFGGLAMGVLAGQLGDRTTIGIGGALLFAYGTVVYLMQRRAAAPVLANG